MSRKLTQEEFESKFYQVYGNKFYVVGEYKDAHTNIEIKCSRCNYSLFHRPNILYEGHATCPFCDYKKSTHSIISGKTDMWATDPSVAKLLLNPEDGYRYRINTSKHLIFKCPVCGKTKLCFPYNVKKQGLSCHYCSDGIKYPNKLMGHILDLLGIVYTPEYKIDKYKYYFDFYFKLNDINYLLEMDGGYGHGHCDTPSSTIEQQIHDDNEKDFIAKEHGYHLIRIDCDYPSFNNRFAYIKHNIIQSEVGGILCLNDDILQKADTLSQSSKVIKFAELWEKGERSWLNFMAPLSIKTKTTVRSYLKKCTELNLIETTYYDSLKLMRN